jgi:hypothetical protein
MKSIREKVAAEVERRNLSSHMNQTKWKIILPRLKTLGVVINLKWLFDDNETGWSKNYLIPTDGYFEETHLGPILFREIEWLELKSSNRDVLSHELVSNNIPHSCENDVFKIWGYSSHGIDFV